MVFLTICLKHDSITKIHCLELDSRRCTFLGHKHLKHGGIYSTSSHWTPLIFLLTISNSGLIRYLSIFCGNTLLCSENFIQRNSRLSWNELNRLLTFDIALENFNAGEASIPAVDPLAAKVHQTTSITEKQQRKNNILTQNCQSYLIQTIQLFVLFYLGEGCRGPGRR